MKRISLLFSLLFFINMLSVPAWAEVPEPEEILAESAVLMDAETGQVLYEKNARLRRQPASITKILTAMLVLENLELDETITASARAVDIPYWGSSAYLQPGERVTVDEAMYAMMLRSANDAANVLAEGVAGSMEDFAELMNRRARELGATDTNFTNANGLPERTHVTTAYDMALITRTAIETPGFFDYFGRDSYTMGATNRYGARIFTNTHRMLLPNYAVYDDDVLGGKTGYTAQAGYTLVTVAERDGRTLICVVMKSSSYYNDTQTLLEFGFEEFEPYTFYFSDAQPLEVAILDGDWEAGIATLSHPQSATVLLHRSVDENGIVTELQLPEAYTLGEEIEGNLTLLAADPVADGLPSTLVDIPLEAEVAIFQPEIVEAMLVVPQSGGGGSRLLLAATAGGFLLLGVLWRRVTVARRRAARRQRVLRSKGRRR